MKIENYPQKILTSLQQILPESESPISLHEPEFSGNEWKYVKDCIDTGWVSSVGSYVNRFEADLCTYTKSNNAVACVNGTAALHMSLILNDVKSEDEVLVPTLTFIAVLNAIRYTNATPHFIDSEANTLGIDVLKLSDYLKENIELRNNIPFNKKTGKKISALVAMHTFGSAVDLDPLITLCEKYNIRLVEDAAEAIGSFYKGKHLGTFAKIGALSFNGNKIITTGGGGALLIQDRELAKKAKHLCTTAKIPHAWLFQHDAIGYNYRLPNINAALGCAQLENIHNFIRDKKCLAEKYAKHFKAIEGINFFQPPQFSDSNYWLNALVLDSNHEQYRDEILKITNEAKIMTRPIWNLMHTLEMFQNFPKMNLNGSETLAKRIFNIPSSPKLLAMLRTA